MTSSEKPSSNTANTAMLSIFKAFYQLGNKVVINLFKFFQAVILCL